MTLTDDVLDYLARTGCSDRAFGRAAIGDSALVGDMRGGRQPGPAVSARLRAFMAAHPDGPRPRDAAVSVPTFLRVQPNPDPAHLPPPSPLPDRPCFRCEARGPCRHRSM